MMMPSLVLGTVHVIFSQFGLGELVHSMSLVPRGTAETASSGIISQVLTKLSLLITTGGEEVEQSTFTRGMTVLGTNSTVVLLLSENNFICINKAMYNIKVVVPCDFCEKWSHLG